MKNRGIMIIALLVIAVASSGILYAIALESKSISTVQTTTNTPPLNATAVNSKVDWTDKKMTIEKDDGAELKIDLKVSNPSNILGTVTDPNGVSHTMNMIKLGNGTVQMSFDAADSDPAGQYVLHVQLTRNASTSDVSLTAGEINHKQTISFPAIHAPGAIICPDGNVAPKNDLSQCPISPSSTQETITIFGGKTLYKYDDIVTASGNVSPVIQNQRIMIQIQFSNGQNVESAQVNPNSDGSFSLSFPMTNSNLSTGTYTIIATYGNAQSHFVYSYVGQ